MAMGEEATDGGGDVEGGNGENDGGMV